MSEVDDECLYSTYDDRMDVCQEERPVTCKYCGQFPLYWGTDFGRWRLYRRRGEQHKCPAYKHPAR